MDKAYRFRIYPTRAQEIQIAKTLGCCRFVYNHYLDLRKTKYERSKESFPYGKCSADLTSLKSEYPWLAEVDSTALQSSLRDLDTAYKNFFHGLKQNRNLKANMITVRSSRANVITANQVSAQFALSRVNYGFL